ncbi:MAG TPA: sugar-binding transcriptional regulator [Asanoa sp.]|nr:sugar-binding transcriptional regulator [Asanoa sp.]
MSPTTTASRPGRDSHARWEGEELLLRVAWFYYKDELTQDEIARRLSLSRASVGRMLDRARKVGLVSISLNTEYLNAFELSGRLRETFGLREALVVPDYESEPDDRAALNTRLGRGGAQFLSTHLRPGTSLGIGWGDTVGRAVNAMNFGSIGPIQLVTLTGGVEGYLHTLLSSRGEPEGGGADESRVAVIPAPIVASTSTLAAALRSEPAIQQVLKRGHDADMALVGVGTPTDDATIVQMGYMSAEDGARFRAKGAVGDILGQFFDIHGKVLALPIHRRRIGIELRDLRDIPTVVGVAGGLHKCEGILGALHGKFLNVLITNELVANRLLTMEAAYKR